jgi:hypothetical protein
MPTCKACGEEIRWIRTRAGKRMPVDAESFAQHDLKPGVTVVSEAGDVLRGGRHVASAAYGYVPHWATCPFADQFKSDGR